MKATNAEMRRWLESLRPLLERNDLIGYHAARNKRKLETEIQEYMTVYNRLIEKYGDPELDEDGNSTGTMRLKVGPNKAFTSFIREITPYDATEHEVDIDILPESMVAGVLTGNEIDGIWWMLKEDEEAQGEN